MSKPVREPALVALEPFVGVWTIEAAGPDGTVWPGAGRAIFEWHPSGAHLVQRTVVEAPGAPDSTSIIGCDGANGTFVQLYSDGRGVCRIYAMTITANEWRLERVGEPFPQRYVGTFSADGCTITGRWERAEDGADFSLDFHLTYRKLSGTTAIRSGP